MGVGLTASSHSQRKRLPPNELIRCMFGDRLQQLNGTKRLSIECELAFAWTILNFNCLFGLLRAPAMRLQNRVPRPCSIVVVHWTGLLPRFRQFCLVRQIPEFFGVRAD